MVVQSQQVVEAFLTAKRSRGLSPRTLETYASILGRFARESPSLPVSPEAIESFLSAIGPSPQTRFTYFKILRTMYRWAAKRRLVRVNPVEDVEPPIVPRKVARSLTLLELAQVLRYPHSPALRAFLFLLADTGVRLSEALSLTPERIKDGLLVVSGKTGERFVPVSPQVQALVLVALPWPWSSKDAASLAVRRAFRAAGVNGKRASSQSLRHTFVRMWEGDESLLVGMLGWTSSRMLEVYRPYNVKRAVEQHAVHSPAHGMMKDNLEVKGGQA